MADSNAFETHELRFVDTPDGFVVALPDAEATEAMGRRIMLLFVGSMLFGVLAILTLIGIPCGMVAIFAPLFVLLGGTRSWWTIEAVPTGVRLGHAHAGEKGAPTVSQLRKPGTPPWHASVGPPRELAWADIVELGHTDYSLFFRMSDGEVHEVLLERTRKADIEEVHQRLHAVWQRVHAGLTDSAEDSDLARQQLEKLARSRVREKAP